MELVIAGATWGSTSIPEGATVPLDMTMSRALTGSDPATVDFTVTPGGAATRGADYTLACGGVDGAVPAGIACSHLTSGTPTLTVTRAQLADPTSPAVSDVLSITASADNLTETGGETLTLTTSGGALSRTLVDAPASVAVRFGSATVDNNEGDTLNVPLRLDAAPGRDLTVPLVFTDGSATGGTDYIALAGTVIKAGQVSHSFQVPLTDDTLDEPDETFTVALGDAPAGATKGTPASTVVTLRDDDPTVVSLSRTGSGGVTEGAPIEFTVSLGRALAAGEVIDVPLSIGGAGVTPAEWGLARQAGMDLNTGVTLSGESTATPALRFSGAGAETATLALIPANDLTMEGTETYTVALGPDGAGANGFDHADLTTNVGGGADPHSSANSFEVAVADGAPVEMDLVITSSTWGSTSIPEGATVPLQMSLSRALTGSDPATVSFTVTLGGAATRGTDYTLACGGVDGTAPAGIACSNLTGSGTPTLTVTRAQLASPGSRFIGEVLSITATTDNTVETGGETLTLTTSGGTVSRTLVDPPASVAVRFGASTRRANENELGGVEIALLLDAAPGRDLTFPLVYTDDTATGGGTDYTAVANTVIKAGQVGHSFSVPVTDDAIDEPDETFTVALGDAPAGATKGTPDSTVVTLRDNDPTVVSLARTGSGGVTEGAPIAFTVSLGRALVAGEVIDVPLAIGGAGVSTADWSLATKTGADLNTGVTLSGESTATPAVRFTGAGAETATLALTPKDDFTAEGAETYTVALGPDGGGANGFDHADLTTNVGGGADPHAGANSFAVAVADGVPVMMDLVITSSTWGSTSIPEGATVPLDMAMSRALTAADPATVSFTVTPGGAATRGTDYTLACGGLDGTAPAGIACSNLTGSGTPTLTVTRAQLVDPTNRRAAAVLSIVATADNTVETGGETLTLTTSGGTVSRTLVDAPASVAVRFSTASVRGSETGAAGLPEPVLFLDAAPGQDLTVPLVFTDGSATGGTDYIALAGTVIKAGQVSHSFQVPLTDDAIDEPDETFTIALGDAPAGATKGTPDSTVVTLRDNDPTVVSLARTGSGGVLEGAPIAFTVSLGRALVAGEIIDVPLAIGGAGVSTADWSLATKAGADLNTGVTLSGESTATPKVRFTGAGAQTATLALTPADDLTMERTETYTVALGPDGAGANGFDHAGLTTNVGGGADPHSSANSFEVAVDDNAPVTMDLLIDSATWGSTTIPEGATVPLDMVMSRALVGSDPATVSFTVALTGAATRGADYTLACGGVDGTVPAGIACSHLTSGTPTLTVTRAQLARPGSRHLIGVLSITASADNLTEAGGETLTLTTSGGTLSRTLVNAPASVAVRFGTATSIGSEALNRRPDITFRLDAASGRDLTVPLVYTDGTATGGGTDYTAVANTVIKAGQITHSFEVPLTNDALDEPDETFTVALGDAPAGATKGTPDSTVVTIVDNDPTVVSLSRTGSGGVLEGAPIEFTVSLGRALAAGEIIDVPLSIGGTGVTPAEWGLSATAGMGLNTGVTLSGTGTATPRVRFTGAGAETATLALTPADDFTAEGTETYTVALGPDGAGTNGFDRADLTTNVGGGADPHATTNRFEVAVADGAPVMMDLVITASTWGSSAIPEGATVPLDMVMSRALVGNDPATVSFTVALTGAATRGADYTLACGGVDGTAPAGIACSHLTSGTPTLTVTRAQLARPGSRHLIGVLSITATADNLAEAGGETLTLTTSGGTLSRTIVNAPASVAVRFGTATSIGSEALNRRPDITFRLDAASGQDLTFPLVYTAGTATGGGTDYTAVANTVIKAGQITHSFEVPLTNDTLDEPDETFTIALGDAPAGATKGTPASTVVTIRDNDPTVVSLSRTGSGGVLEGAPIAFTVSLGRALAAGEVIDVPLAVGGAGVSTADWSLATQTGMDLNTGVTLSGESTATPAVRFTGAGAETATLALTPKDDFTAEGAETYTVALGPDGAGTNGFDHADLTTNVGGGADPHAGANSFAVAVADGAPVEMDLVIDTGTWGSSTIPEGATVPLSMRLSRALTGSDPATVSFAVALGGTAVRGTDYTLACGGLDGAAPAGIACSHLTGSGAPTLTVTRAQLADPTSPAVSDVLSITASADNTTEAGGETLTLTTSGGTLSRTLVDAPASVAVRFGTAASVGNEMYDAVGLVLRLDAAPGRDLTFPLVFTDGTATGGTDYRAVAEALIRAGQIRHRLEVPLTDDAIDEPDETVTIALGAAPAGATKGARASTVLTIEDNDPTVVSLARTGSGGVTEGDPVAFTVSLGRALVAGEIVGVPLAVGGAGVSTKDWSLARQTGADLNTGVTLSGTGTATPALRFTGAGAQTATLALIPADDMSTEGEETYTVALGPDGSGTNGFDRAALGTSVGGGADPHATTNRFEVAVVDAGPVTMDLVYAFGNYSTSIPEGATVPLTMVLSRTLTADDPATVDFTVTPGGGATRGTDYTLACGGLDGAAPAGIACSHLTSGTPTLTVTRAQLASPGNRRIDNALSITASADNLTEAGGETLTLTTSGGTLSRTLVDAPASVAVRFGSATVDNNEGDTLNVPLRLDAAPGQDLTVPLVFTDGSATGGGTDYTAVANTVIKAGQDSREINVPLTDDTLDEPDETFTIALGDAPAGATKGTPDSTVVTLRDDDPTVVSLARTGSGGVTEGAPVAFTVSLGRALVAGEVIDVPLSIGGTNVSTADWSLARQTGTDLNTGVTLSGESTATPKVRFTGAGAETATLALIPKDDFTAEGAETYTVALGPDGSGTNGFDHADLTTNVGGGADPHAGANSFAVAVADGVPVMMDLVITSSTWGSTSIPEGATVPLDMIISRALTGSDPATVSFTVTLGGAATRGTDYTLACGGLDGAAPAGIACSNLTGSGTPTLTVTRAQLAKPGSRRAAAVLSIVATTDSITETGGETLTLTTSGGTVSRTLVDAPASVAVRFSTGTTSPQFEGSLAEPALLLDAAPGQDLTFPLVYTDDTATGGGTDYTAVANTVIKAGQITHSFQVPLTDDTLDEPDETFTIALGDAPAGATRGTPASTVLTLRDNDPTVVSLARTGSGGVTEGAPIEFTVSLGRALVAGEVIDVPLAVGGTGVSTADWSLATKTGADLNTGVTLSGESTATPKVRFTGAGAETATLALTPKDDFTAEGAETYTVALGPDGAGTNGFDHAALTTNVGGGADPHSSANSFEVAVADGAPVMMDLTITSGTWGSSTIPEGATVPLTMVLSRTLTGSDPATVSFTVALSGAATRGTDYTLACGFNGVVPAGIACSHLTGGTPTLTVTRAQLADPNNRRAANVLSITATTDSLTEAGGETLTLTTSGGTLSRTLVDAPASVSVRFAQSTQKVHEDITAGRHLFLLLDAAPGRDLTFPLVFTDDTATGGGTDYRAVAGTVIKAGQVGHSFSVPVTNDTLDEPDETVTVALGDAPAGATRGTPDSTVVTIVDDDPTVVSLARTGTGGVIEGAPIAFTVSLGRALVAGEVIDVPLAVGGTGVTPAEWGLARQTGMDLNTGVTLSGESTATPKVRFTGAGAETAALALTPADDMSTEGEETYTVALGPDGAGANGFDRADLTTNVGGGADPHSSANRFAVAVADNTPVTMDLLIAGATWGSSAIPEGATVPLNMELSRALVGGDPATVVFTVTPGGAATRGADYTLACGGVDGTVPAGIACSNLTGSGTPTLTVTRAQLADPTNRRIGHVLSITATTDSITETGGETLTLTTSGGTLSRTLVDAPASVAVRFGSATVDNNEGDTLNVPLRLDAAPGRDLTVPLVFTDGSATGGTDYTAVANTVIKAGQITHSFEVPLTDDAIDEPDETVTVALGDAPAGATKGTPDSTVVTLRDDDPTVVSLARTGSGGVTEGAPVAFTVSLGRALVAGEVIDVPLAIGGAGVTPAEWGLSATAGMGLNTGVTLSGATTATPRVRFTGAGAETATLALIPKDDFTAEGAETYTVALGPDGGGTNGFDHADLTTNVGGGADPHATTNRFEVAVADGAPVGMDLVITSSTWGSTSIPEGATVPLNMELSRALTADDPATVDFTVTPGGGAVRGTDYTLACGGLDGAAPAGIACSHLTSGTPTLTVTRAQLADPTSPAVSDVLSITASADNLTEAGGETLTLTTSGGTLSRTLVDAPASVAVRFGSATVDNNEGDTLNVPLRLDAAPGQDLTVPLVFTDDTATGGGTDYRIGCRGAHQGRPGLEGNYCPPDGRRHRRARRDLHRRPGRGPGRRHQGHAGQHRGHPPR